MSTLGCHCPETQRPAYQTILQTLAVVALLSEAVLVYNKSWPANRLNHLEQKTMHTLLHSSAAFLVGLGLAAVITAKNVKRPEAYPNFWSVRTGASSPAYHPLWRRADAAPTRRGSGC